MTIETTTPTTTTPTKPALRKVRVEGRFMGGVPWAGRTWPSGVTETEVDAQTALDLAEAPSHKLGVEFLDGSAPHRAQPAPTRPPTTEEALRSANERASFFQNHAQTVEKELRAEIDRLMKRHAGELDTLKAQIKVVQSIADAKVAKAEAEKEEAYEALVSGKPPPDPFTKVPMPPEPPKAPGRGGR